jgi:hypothetical protein
VEVAAKNHIKPIHPGKGNLKIEPARCIHFC